MPWVVRWPELPTKRVASEIRLNTFQTVQCPFSAPAPMYLAESCRINHVDFLQEKLLFQPTYICIFSLHASDLLIADGYLPNMFRCCD